MIRSCFKTAGGLAVSLTPVTRSFSLLKGKTNNLSFSLTKERASGGRVHNHTLSIGLDMWMKPVSIDPNYFVLIVKVRFALICCDPYHVPGTCTVLISISDRLQLYWYVRYAIPSSYLLLLQQLYAMYSVSEGTYAAVELLLHTSGIFWYILKYHHYFLRVAARCCILNNGEIVRYKNRTRS